MKTLRILKSVAVAIVALFLINSCDKIESPEPMGDAGQTIVKLFPAGFKLIALDAVSASQKAVMFEVRRDVANDADLNTATTALLKFDQAILDTYNVHNGMNLEVLDATLATITPAPSADGSIVLNFAPGEFSKSITVTIPDATKFDFSKQYGFGYEIQFTGGTGKLSEAAEKEVVVQVLVKNKYDGVYEVTANSPMVDVLNATLTGYYPFVYVLETSGAHSVMCYDRDVWGDYMHPILSGANVSGYGQFGLEIFFDPSGSGKIVDVKNPWGNPPPLTRMPVIDESGINAWNPTTKNVDFKYFMIQPSLVPDAPHIRVYFDETWTYKGPR